MDSIGTTRIDVQKLQLLNDRICQVLDALYQLRLSAHATTFPVQATYGTTIGTPHAPYAATPYNTPYGTTTYAAMNGTTFGVPFGSPYGNPTPYGFSTPYAIPTSPFGIPVGTTHGIPHGTAPAHYGFTPWAAAPGGWTCNTTTPGAWTCNTPGAWTHAPASWTTTPATGVAFGQGVTPGRLGGFDGFDHTRTAAGFGMLPSYPVAW